ncbi:MAG: oligoendopeptidase, partial [Thermoanaerobacter sp.]|nr:oligoendopeptidase [Thermoanaerobacter sp.]
MEILKDRSEIEDKYKWRLEDIYENENLWEEDYNKTKELLKEIVKFKGKINTSRNLLEVLKLNDQIGMTASKIFAYARMRRDEDNTNPKYQALTDKA